jgi:hypothetical protein
MRRPAAATPLDTHSPTPDPATSTLH